MGAFADFYENTILPEQQRKEAAERLRMLAERRRQLQELEQLRAGRQPLDTGGAPAVPMMLPEQGPSPWGLEDEGQLSAALRTLGGDPGDLGASAQADIARARLDALTGAIPRVGPHAQAAIGLGKAPDYPHAINAYGYMDADRGTGEVNPAYTRRLESAADANAALAQQRRRLAVQPADGGDPVMTDVDVGPDGSLRATPIAGPDGAPVRAVPTAREDSASLAFQRCMASGRSESECVQLGNQAKAPSPEAVFASALRANFGDTRSALEAVQAVYPGWQPGSAGVAGGTPTTAGAGAGAPAGGGDARAQAQLLRQQAAEAKALGYDAAVVDRMLAERLRALGVGP